MCTCFLNSYRLFGSYFNLVSVQKYIWIQFHFCISVFKCLTLKTVHGRKIYHTWEEIERLVAEKKVDVTQVVSHRFPMSQYDEAFKVLFNGSACKIIMDPSK